MVLPRSFDPPFSFRFLAAQQMAHLPPLTELLPPLNSRLPLVARELFPCYAMHSMDFGFLVFFGLQVLATMSLIFSRRDFNLT
jgi:hypothetical protein